MSSNVFCTPSSAVCAAARLARRSAVGSTIGKWTTVAMITKLIVVLSTEPYRIRTPSVASPFLGSVTQDPLRQEL